MVTLPAARSRAQTAAVNGSLNKVATVNNSKVRVTRAASVINYNLYVDDACAVANAGDTVNVDAGSYALLSKIAAKVGTPFWFYDAAVLRQRIADIKFMTSAPGVQARFAMKACPVTKVLREMAASKIWIDAVSGNEALRALRAGGWGAGRCAGAHGSRGAAVPNVCPPTPPPPSPPQK